MYDEYFDDVICPGYRPLHCSTTNREGYQEYKKSGQSLPRFNYLKEVYRRRQERENSLAPCLAGLCGDGETCPALPAVYKELYNLRRKKIERVFLMRRKGLDALHAVLRGLAGLNWVKLKFAAMNLKKMTTWKWKASHPGRMATNGQVRAETHKTFRLFSPSMFLFDLPKPASG